MAIELLQELSVLLQGSSLSDEARTGFLLLLRNASSGNIQNIVDLLKTDIAWAKELYENYLAKKEAMQSGDSTRWDEIIKNELEQLEKLNQ